MRTAGTCKATNVLKTFPATLCSTGAASLLDSSRGGQGAGEACNPTRAYRGRWDPVWAPGETHRIQLPLCWRDRVKDSSPLAMTCVRLPLAG